MDPSRGVVQEWVLFGNSIIVVTSVPVIVVNTSLVRELVLSVGFQITLSLHDMEAPTPQTSENLRHTSVECLTYVIAATDVYLYICGLLLMI